MTTGTAPTTGDDAYIRAVPGVTLASIGAVDMSAVTLNSLTIDQSYTGTIGTTAADWKISATTISIGAPPGDGSSPIGSGRIRINTGTVAYTATVFNTGTAVDSGLEAVRLLCNSASNVLNVLGGRSVGVATTTPGSTSTIGTVNVTGGKCNLGSGVTWTTATVAAGGNLTTNSGGTTLTTSSGGTATTQGTNAITTINIGGYVFINHRPATAATTVNVYPSGTADFSGNPASTTVTTANLYGGGTILVNPASPSHITFTNRPLINAGRLAAS